MMGPCLCGDIECPSCGPAQGNTRCPICRAWATSGCDHLDADGNVLPAHQAEAERLLAEEAAAWNAEAEEHAAWRDQPAPTPAEFVRLLRQGRED